MRKQAGASGLDRTPSDEVLAKIAAGAIPGDTRAFSVLVERHQHHVVTNCRFLGGSEADAEDLAQEVFLKAYANVARFEGRSSFRAWLRRIKANHCFSFLRARKGKRFVDWEGPVAQSAPELRTGRSSWEETRRIGERDRVREVLEAMPDSLRVPLILCDMDGLSYREIAEELEIGLSATKMRIKRAREMFRQRFEGRRARRPAPPASPGGDRASGPA